MPHYFNTEYLFYWIYRLLTAPWRFLAIPRWLPAVWSGLIALLWLAIIILSYQIARLRQEEKKDLRSLLEAKAAAGQANPVNQRWERVKKYLESENQAEWKQAIIEADIMLDDLVKTLKPDHADWELGERLKLIEAADFETLNQAWQAHKLRNRISHEADVVLTKREVQEAFNCYRQVFEEFEYI